MGQARGPTSKGGQKASKGPKKEEKEDSRGRVSRAAKPGKERRGATPGRPTPSKETKAEKKLRKLILEDFRRIGAVEAVTTVAAREPVRPRREDER